MSSVDQPSGPGSPLRARMSVVIVAVAVVVMLALGLLAMVFYSQAQDYRGAKYRAQYALVMEIYQSIPSLNESIGDIVDDSLDNGFRRSAATFAQATADSVSGACHAIEVMYPPEDVKSMTFSALKAAFASLAQTAETACNQLTDPTPDVNAPVEEALIESQVLIVETRTFVYDGVDPDVLPEDVSYDLLDGMNLVIIYSTASALEAAQP